MINLMAFVDEGLSSFSNEVAEQAMEVIIDTASGDEDIQTLLESTKKYALKFEEQIITDMDGGEADFGILNTFSDLSPHGFFD